MKPGLASAAFAAALLTTAAALAAAGWSFDLDGAKPAAPAYAGGFARDVGAYPVSPVSTRK